MTTNKFGSKKAKPAGQLELIYFARDENVRDVRVRKKTQTNDAIAAQYYKFETYIPAGIKMSLYCRNQWYKYDVFPRGGVYFSYFVSYFKYTYLNSFF